MSAACYLTGWLKEEQVAKSKRAWTYLQLKAHWKIWREYVLACRERHEIGEEIAYRSRCYRALAILKRWRVGCVDAHGTHALMFSQEFAKWSKGRMHMIVKQTQLAQKFVHFKLWREWVAVQKSLETRRKDLHSRLVKKRLR